MHADVNVEKSAVVNANAAVEERRYLQGEFIHLLERETGNVNVGSGAERMFALGDAAYILIVPEAAVAVVHDDGLIGQRAQAFQSCNQAGIDLQLAAAMAGQFGL